MNIEIIRNTLYKVEQPNNLLTDSKCVLQSTLSTSTNEIESDLSQSYLESFYNFCLNIGGETADVMCEILAFEADRRWCFGQ